MRKVVSVILGALAACFAFFVFFIGLTIATFCKDDILNDYDVGRMI